VGGHLGTLTVVVVVDGSVVVVEDQVVVVQHIMIQIM
jgi:hypothetical protein